MAPGRRPAALVSQRAGERVAQATEGHPAPELEREISDGPTRQPRPHQPEEESNREDHRSQIDDRLLQGPPQVPEAGGIGIGQMPGDDDGQLQRCRDRDRQEGPPRAGPARCQWRHRPTSIAT